MPSMPGIHTSSNTISGENSVKCVNAFSPEEAVITSYPSSSRILVRVSSMLSSSSTIRMVAFVDLANVFIQFLPH